MSLIDDTPYMCPKEKKQNKKGRSFLLEEGDAGEEVAGLGVVELRGIGDVAARFGQIGRDRRDDAPARAALHGQHM